MRRFVTADLHLGHSKITEFLKDDDTKLRPWDTVEEMNAALIKNWNETVGPDDLVYVLGDFTVNKKHIWMARELAGRKILVKGNHDNGSLAEYAEYFEDVVACVVRKNAILTHIPVHTSQLGRFKHNIHGHLHARRVQKWVGCSWAGSLNGSDTGWIDDKDFTCVSVEQTDWKPILLQTVMENI